MIVVVSGIRDLALASHGAVRDAIESAAEGATELRFGGAVGVDTVALRAAHALPVRKVVYVPFTLAQQPKDAQTAIEACADAVIELRLGDPATNKGAYLERNIAMLIGQGARQSWRCARVLGSQESQRNAQADMLLAFIDGRTTGGTSYTIRQARKLGINPDVVTVVSDRSVARDRKRHGFRR